MTEEMIERIDRICRRGHIFSESCRHRWSDVDIVRTRKHCSKHFYNLMADIHARIWRVRFHVNVSWRRRPPFKLTSNIPNCVSDSNSSNYSFNRSSSPQNLLKQLTNLQLNTEKIFTPQLRILEFLLCRYKCRISMADWTLKGGLWSAARLWVSG